eukprot:s2941_g8.t1
MSLEPLPPNPCEVESKGSRGWIFILPFSGDVAQLSQAACVEKKSFTGFQGQAEGNFSSLSSSPLRAMHVCLKLFKENTTQAACCPFAIDEFHSLHKTQYPFDEKSLNGFQGQAEESSMSQGLCHLAVNVRRAPSEQSLCM